MPPPPIRFAAATYQTGTAVLVHDISFDVQAAETVVLVGRSGSGKTTALRLVNRLLAPTAGVVEVQGKPTTAWDPVALRRHIGYVIQEVGLFPHMTIAENIALLPRLEGAAPERQREIVDRELTRVGLDPAIRDRYPRQLSGGQRQRVGVARALSLDPPLMLMDEPFGALDPITRNEIQREFLQLRENLGKTIVLVTHDIREATLLGNRIGVMESGELIWLGTPAEFAAESAPKIAALREANA